MSRLLVDCDHCNTAKLALDDVVIISDRHYMYTHCDTEYVREAASGMIEAMEYAGVRRINDPDLEDEPLTLIDLQHMAVFRRQLARIDDTIAVWTWETLQ